MTSWDVIQSVWTWNTTPQANYLVIAGAVVAGRAQAGRWTDKVATVVATVIMLEIGLVVLHGVRWLLVN